MNLIGRITQTYSWYRGFGHETLSTPLARVVRDVRHPQVWAANHLSEVRADTAADIAAVFDLAETHFRHCPHRFFDIDPATPAAFVAQLAMRDYAELAPTIQMVLQGDLARSVPEIEIRQISTDAHWDELLELLREHFQERSRPHGMRLDDEVARGLVAGFRAKARVVQFFLAVVEDTFCAYGAAVVSPLGLGIIEDLYTAPAYRNRGIATAIIARGVRHIREHDVTSVLIGAHADQAPKHLYASLGFEPICLTREYLKRVKR